VYRLPCLQREDASLCRFTSARARARTPGSVREVGDDIRVVPAADRAWDEI